MPTLLKALQSQVGRKILTAITGIGLMLFIIGHLIGNLSLFAEDPAFNKYTLALESLGPILYIVEAIIAIGILLHAWVGISIWWRKRKARPEGYKINATKGSPSHKTFSSQSMIFTGIVLFVFLIIHINHFKFGPTDTIMIDGHEAKDLKELVVDTFINPLWAFGYTAVMVLLGFHLRHGFWSALTSLTMKHKSYSFILYTIGTIFAILMAVGFIFIPLYIFFTGGQGALI